MKKIKLSLVVSVVGVAVMLIPMATHNHIYKTIVDSSDIQAHSQMLEIIAESHQLGTNVYPMLYLEALVGIAKSDNISSSLGVVASDDKSQSGAILYPIQYLFGWVFGQISKVIPINPQLVMLWFMFLVLAGVALTLYSLGRAIGVSPWLTLLIPLFCTTSILGLFSYGVVYGIFNMYIILPWGVIAILRWTETRKRRWLWIGGGLSALFLVAHPTGLYLLFTLPIAAVGGSLRSLKLKWLMGTLSLAIGTIVVWRIGWLRMSYDFSMAMPYFRQFIMDFVSPVTTTLGLLAAWGLWRYRKALCFSSKTKAALLIIGSFAGVLIGGSVLRLTVLPERIMLDAATMIAIFIAICLGELMKAKESPWFPLTAYGLIGVGVISSVIVWVT